MDPTNGVAPGGEPTHEELNVTYTGDAYRLVERPRVNYRLGAVEGLQIIAGQTDLHALRRVAPRTTERFYETNRKAWYAEPMDPHLFNVIALLREDPATRHAVVFIGDNGVGENDRTCASSVQFLLRRGVVHCVVTMRSWDLFMGLPYNCMMFGLLAQAVAVCVQGPEYRTPQLAIQAASAHVYDKHVSRIGDIELIPTKRMTLAHDWHALGDDWGSFRRLACQALKDVAVHGNTGLVLVTDT